MASASTGDSPVPALVSVDWLAARLGDPRVRIADVRWYLPHLGRSGRAEYVASHLPGAVFVDLDTELAGPPGAATALKWHLSLLRRSARHPDAWKQ